MLHSDANNMHSDSSATDTHAVRGPERADAEVRRFQFGALAGECAGFTFDKNHRIVTVCVKASRSELILIDPATLSVLDRFEIPARQGTYRAVFALRIDSIFLDTSGGSYFYLDHEGRAVVATADRRILRIKQVRTSEGPRFVLDREYSLAEHVPGDCPKRPDLAAKAPGCDKVTTALPDWQGLIWFVTRKGRVGTLDPESSRIQVIRLKGEEIQNSFAVAEDGVYLVTDKALYRLAASAKTGKPGIVWREAYDRGTRRKIGQVAQGSGTTPTLLDSRYVAIADNAEPRINALVYRRQARPGESRLICKVPVFETDRSATDNSFVGFGRSLIVENNSGYRHAFTTNNPVGGILRIDIRPDESGCDIVWQNPAISPSTVLKMSRESRLIYAYTVEAHPIRRDLWSLTTIDFHTGRTVLSIPVGRGMRLDNNWGSIALGPEPGTALIGTLSGFVQVRDR